MSEASKAVIRMARNLVRQKRWYLGLPLVIRRRMADGKMRPQTYVTHGGLVWLRDRWQAKLLTDARDAERTREVEKARLQGDLGL
ncbi:hypothetical protein [Methylorubrum extorquens]|uniref:Uncharacterized protein n=1 Tax=Methylorubrum extorquens TaxID=408 RepID=A0AAX3WBD0_METEX|nr:hypothetical protein [Methylorubrum extorquens]WHQ68642.1 hypothetical protein KEC54_20065 [Methylorubrum extorquens]